jgi:ADP-ribose pyrophosphatase YjhB (NUDIX family)
MLKQMTEKEKEGLTRGDFFALWKELWGDAFLINKYKMEEMVSREKFNQLVHGIHLKNDFYTLSMLVDESKPFETWTEPEWGFPKGRRIRAETDVECAIREFNEETNIPREAYTLLRNVVLEETFTGLNGIEYRHVYFVGLLNPGGTIDLTQRFTYMQRREISAIGWKTLIQCSAFVRPHHLERQKMLNTLKTIVETYESE